MTDTPTILAIETSCDDTAAAVMVGNRLLSNVCTAQPVHGNFGGVVPELAGRAHQQLIVPVVQAALEEAGVVREDLQAVAVTYGPGLVGSLLVGLSFAKALALALDIPLVGVNHLEGHVYSVFVDEPHPAFPYLCLTVSGGHTQLDIVRQGFVHENLGRTRDDAAGEAFDKVAKMMGLGFPFPEAFAWFSGVSEFAGGLLLAIGLLTRPAALLIVINMSVALIFGHIAAGDTFGGMELAMFFFAAAVCFLMAGAGRYSADGFIRVRMESKIVSRYAR